MFSSLTSSSSLSFSSPLLLRGFAGFAIMLMTAAGGVFGLAACNDKDAAPGSCFRPADNACIDYEPSEAAAGKRLCSGMTWTLGAKSCPSASRVGMCTPRDGKAKSEWLYSGAPNNYSMSGARSACEARSGVFTAAPAPPPSASTP